MSEESKPVRSVEPGVVQNILNVPPQLVRQNFTSLVMSPLEVRDERMLNARLEVLTRSYIQPFSNPLTVAAPPTSVTAMYTSLVSSMVEMYRMRVSDRMKLLSTVAEKVFGSRSAEVGEREVTLDDLPAFAEEVLREVEMETAAFFMALMRLSALVAENLPPQYRSAILNMSLTGYDVISAPQVPQEQLLQLLQQLQAAAGEEETAARRTRRGRRRRS